MTPQHISSCHQSERKEMAQSGDRKLSHFSRKLLTNLQSVSAGGAKALELAGTPAGLVRHRALGK
jgi:hypothetical protein